MNDGHQETHVGLAPGCLMWTPILPMHRPAVAPESVVHETSGTRSPVKDGVPATSDGADKNVQKN